MAFIFLCHGFDADDEVMVCSSTAVLVECRRASQMSGSQRGSVMGERRQSEVGSVISYATAATNASRYSQYVPGIQFMHPSYVCVKADIDQIKMCCAYCP